VDLGSEEEVVDHQEAPNKALHLTTIPLRAIVAGELGR
jgi:hypothetical protein